MFIRRIKFVLICCVCINLFVATQLWGEMDLAIDNLKEQLVSPPSQITEEIFFGSSVAISDQYAIIGSKSDNQAITMGGSACIYEKNDGKWVFIQKFVGSNPHKNDYLGGSVAVSGNFVFAGAQGYDYDEIYKDMGIVYVYQRQESGDWIQTQTLAPDSIDDSHKFGCAMATSNMQIIVGAYGNSNESGKAFLFELENDQWIQRQCLTPEIPDIGGRFGIAVDIDNDYIIVGAYLGYDYQGAAYIYQKQESDWKQIELFKSPVLDQISHFGYAVSINDHYAAVGSKSERQVANIRNTGAVYVYQRNENTWEQMPKLLEDDLQKDDKFGVSLALEGNILAVGGTKLDSNIENSGAVNIYRIEENSFTFLRKIAAQQPHFEDYYASSLAMTHDMILIGAELYSNSNGNRTGGAYFYSLEMRAPFGQDNILGMDDIIHWLQVLSGH